MARLEGRSETGSERRVEKLEARYPPAYRVDLGCAVELRRLGELAQAARNRAQEPAQESHQPPPEPVRSASVEPGDLALDHMLVGSHSRTAAAAADWQRQNDRDRFTEFGGHGSVQRVQTEPEHVG
jgi:hypothetical protein